MNKILNSKVSIILPTYNGSMYIRQSIKSCLNQTYNNIELIVIDDGSSEDIKQIVDSYKDDRISYFKHSKNLGLPSALNTGFAHSKGKYLTWTSDDNFYESKAIEVMVKFLEENSDIDFVYANYYVIDKDGEILESRKVSPPRVLDWKDCIGPCFLYRREVYEKIGEYDSRFILAEDYEYWLRIREQFKIKNLNEYLYFYRRHEDSLSVQNKSLLIGKQAAKASGNYISLSAKYYHQGWVFLYEIVQKLLSADILTKIEKDKYFLTGSQISDFTLVNLGGRPSLVKETLKYYRLENITIPLLQIRKHYYSSNNTMTG